MTETVHSVGVTVSEARLLIEAIEQHFHMAGEDALPALYETLKEIAE